MSIPRHHAEWLSLVPVSGPFLSLPVLMEAFPQGLDAHDAEHARLLRLAHEEWDDSFEKRKADPSVHEAWIKFVLTKTLEFDESLLAEGQAVPQTLQVEVPEHGELLRPSIVLNDPGTKKARMLIQTYPRSQDLSSYVAGSRWKASPDTRMTDLLHGTGVRLGLVTNGEHWMLVDAPKGETTGYASWYASLWREEKITLRAFRSLLSMARFFGVADDQTLEALLAKSASNQQEVTDQLGLQVRRAVEVLIQSLDKADQDHGRELLESVSEAILYESALTVMMRLVFLFCAEERELIPTKPFPVYEQNYSVSMISRQLREIADQNGEELLERRFDAWPRLLSAFRAVFGGLGHDDVYMPAYGGRLFDPDRFPFLEGRKRGTSWQEAEANPLPVNNRTVLHLLEALQLLQVKVPGGGPAEARRLSFRALDIEQIGHVYEGLLDHTAKRAAEPFLGLFGKKEPEVALKRLEQGRAKSDQELFKLLKDETGGNRKWEKYLDVELEDRQQVRLRTACGNDESIYQRVLPFAGLLRDDSFGYPVVIPQGSVFVTAGTDRRSSGTHYTPRSLTEPIVRYTLEPLVYVGPAEGKPKAEWKLKSAAELLDLKICDMACGSGAFLVQAARYMSVGLLDAGDQGERGEGRGVRGEGENHVNSIFFREANHEGSALSGTDCLAEVDGTGEALLQADEDLSEGRVIRDGESDPAGSGIDPGKHRRGERPSAHEGISEPLEHRSGIVGGSGNPSHPEQRSGTANEERSAAMSRPVGRNQPNALRPSQVAEKTPLKEGGEEERGEGSGARGEEKEALVPRPSPLTPSDILVPRPSPLTPRITPDGKPSTGEPNESLIPDDPAERTTYAMRIIAQRCLYGVDINPLAAEMAKLSLWLLTLAKDKPFEFLDHAIRCGDSLVGIHDIDQLRHFNLKPDADDAVLFGGPFEEAVEQAIDLRLMLETSPANSVEDIETQEQLLAAADDEIARLRCAADLLVAAEFWGENAKDKQERLRHAAVVAGHYVENGPTDEFEGKAEKERRGQRMFHWPLEFPEVVVKRGGFDAFVCNPPFMHGRRVSTTFGDHYLQHMKTFHSAVNASADLVAYFVLRMHCILKVEGCQGFISTQGIAEGDTRETSLDWMLSNRAAIANANPDIVWPGQASVRVCMLIVWKGLSPKTPLLRDKPVQYISSLLSSDSQQEKRAPEQLAANKEVVFTGTYVYGRGYVLDDEAREHFLSIDPRNGERIKPYLRGEDINRHPAQAPKDWVIDFDEMSEVEARHWPSLFAHLEKTVKPERAKQTKQVHEPCYWKHWDKRPELYAKLTTMRHCLVHAFVGKHIGFAFVDTNQVIATPTPVFATESRAFFAALQSSLHWVWVVERSSKMGTSIRYTPSDCFQTFPLPDPLETPALQAIGASYEQYRAKIMKERNEGLTKSYNRFHDPDESSADIQKLRDLQVEMDRTVAAAYGWGDLDLGHAFHETKQGLRFTISEPARREVLQRLLKLNHERYEEEVKQGLHEKKGRGARGKGRGKKKAAKNPEASLFDTEGGS